MRGKAQHTGSTIPALIMSMFSFFACFYIGGRLWQDAESRVFLIKQLEKNTGQGGGAISVDDTLRILDCKDQQKKLATLDMELAAAKSQGFTTKHPSTTTNATTQRLIAVIGIQTEFGHRSRRDSIRKTWMPTGFALEKLESEKGMVVRFVVGRSASKGDSWDKMIIKESNEVKDFLILDDHVEASEELPKKTKIFFKTAVETWDADFYVKVNDDVFVNIDKLGAMLASHRDKSRVYIGCMKSGEVFSEPQHKWFEPEWWKFGDKKSYFRHASGEIFVLSRVLAQFISVNSAILKVFAHEDVSVGSWMLGLNVEHVDEKHLCCSGSGKDAICATP